MLKILFVKKLENQFGVIRITTEKVNDHCDSIINRNQELEQGMRDKLTEFYKILEERENKNQTSETTVLNMLAKEREKYDQLVATLQRDSGKVQLKNDQLKQQHDKLLRN